MSYQSQPDLHQYSQIRKYRQRLIEKTEMVPPSGGIVEQKGRNGRFYFVLPGVHWPNEPILPLLENYVVSPEDNVLDFGTGCGVIAIDAAFKGANYVEGYDINLAAIESARVNSQLKGFPEDKVNFYHNMLFSRRSTKFNIITANLPFTDENYSNTVERAAFDKDLAAHRELFETAARRLSEDGRIYLSQADFGAVDRVLEIAAGRGFKNNLIGESKDTWAGVPVRFYAFELTRKR